MLVTSRFLPLLLLCFTSRAADSWPQFRGPDGSGVDSSTGYPVEFSPSKNVLWKAALPFGQSSPVVSAGHVYLTAGDADQLLTICLDERTGRELWRRSQRRAHKHETYRANDPASPTPAADSHGVVSFFADFGLVAYSHEGTQQWSLPLGPFKNFYGMASSPVIAGELVVMLCDQQAGSFLLAIDRKTGRQRWKTPRAGAPIGWSTPLVFRPSNAPPQIIVLGSTRLDAYYLSTGESRWWMPLGSMGALGTPLALGDALLVSTQGANEPWMPTFESMLEKYDKDKDSRLSRAEFTPDPDLGEHFGWLDTSSDNLVDAPEWNEARSMGMGEYGALVFQPTGAKGKVDPSAVRWRIKKNLPYVPAPIAYQDVVYLVRSGGIVTSIDPASGQLLKEGRSRDALGEYMASPVAADGKLYLASSEGKITVLKAAREWEVLAVNDLDEETNATPALSGGRVFIRTRSRIYCFASPAR
jgi:outer membrane protein assembly factor BamB